MLASLLRVLSLMPKETDVLTCTYNRDLGIYRILGPCSLKPALSHGFPVV